jgi:hypothetical protein
MLRAAIGRNAKQNRRRGDESPKAINNLDGARNKKGLPIRQALDVFRREQFDMKSYLVAGVGFEPTTFGL